MKLLANRRRDAQEQVRAVVAVVADLAACEGKYLRTTLFAARSKLPADYARADEAREQCICFASLLVDRARHLADLGLTFHADQVLGEALEATARERGRVIDEAMAAGWSAGPNPGPGPIGETTLARFKSRTERSLKEAC